MQSADEWHGSMLCFVCMVHVCGAVVHYRKYSGMSAMYLRDHHVAVECASSQCVGGLFDALSDLGHHGRAECQVGDEVAVHDVDLGCSVK